MLHKHRKAIEDHLFARALDLFDLEPTIALYDLTNSFLEGSGKSIDKAKYGRSKERRVESAGGAPAVGSGGLSVAFAPGLSPASLTVFPPAAHRTGRAALPHPALQADHATRTRTTASPHGALLFRDLHGPCFLHDLSPLIIRPVYALITPRGVPSMPHGSFTFACDAAEVSDHLPV